jgi:hypothetical protein
MPAPQGYQGRSWSSVSDFWPTVKMIRDISDYVEAEDELKPKREITEEHREKLIAIAKVRKIKNQEIYEARKMRVELLRKRSLVQDEQESL